jgi:hypothetical protein
MTCRFFKSSHCRGVCTFLFCTTTAGEWCRNHEERILFDHITASAEELAEKLVYEIRSTDPVFGGTYYWWCSTIIPGEKWAKREEAIVATIEELKEKLK